MSSTLQEPTESMDEYVNRMNHAILGIYHPVQVECPKCKLVFEAVWWTKWNRQYVMGWCSKCHYSGLCKILDPQNLPREETPRGDY